MRSAPSPGAPVPVQWPAAPKKPEAQKPEGEQKKEGEAAGAKDGEKSDNTVAVKREAVTEQANPINEEVRWADDGEVQFSVHNQTWKVVLQRIADASKLSLDWQELLGYALNLTTTRSYGLDEVRDVLNRHLLLRGYRMLLHGEILSIVKLSELKSSLVPRVTPEQLD